jgi:hypothetical protein
MDGWATNNVSEANMSAILAALFDIRRELRRIRILLEENDDEGDSGPDA